MGCLPRTGDSTRFEVTIVVDSIGMTSGSLLVIPQTRSAPRPGYINQVVTVEMQRAGQTRFVGTSCWQDAGIVVRGNVTTLADAKVFLVAQGKILVRVMDGRGAILYEGTHVPGLADGERIGWLESPPSQTKSPPGS